MLDTDGVVKSLPILEPKKVFFSLKTFHWKMSEETKKSQKMFKGCGDFMKFLDRSNSRSKLRSIDLKKMTQKRNRAARGDS